MIAWLTSWWETFLVWRSADAEQRAILLGHFNEDDFIEVERP